MKVVADSLSPARENSPNAIKTEARIIDFSRPTLRIIHGVISPKTAKHINGSVPSKLCAVVPTEKLALIILSTGGTDVAAARKFNETKMIPGSEMIPLSGRDGYREG